MKTFTLELPTMFGDHHVLEVRRLLFGLPGVQEVYASSAFQVVEATYDPGKTSEAEIMKKLEEAGYLGEMVIPEEAGVAAYGLEGAKPPFIRHTEVYETTRQVVSFAQSVDLTTKALWPCPGMGIVRKMEE
jgi:copper chaperone CopZ